ncbi:hypothetical protein HPP92_005634 [Vanilla planifolia]|uniref:VQ domain-containing protein n=1 Tax=Vanilla planifolia TaxID=51239 RepID=A0A835VDC9_VANPL|nr:hypothetical protein HPP92_005634 [Vanilla planifolia]
MDKPSATATATSDPPTSPSPPATTYVQTDATSFKELVQRLTGPHDEPALASSTSSQKLSAVRRPAFKLHERRQASRSKLSVLKPLLGSRLATGELGSLPAWPEPVDLAFHAVRSAGHLRRQAAYRRGTGVK